MLTLESGKGARDFLLHLFVLFLSQARVEGVAFQGATATDAGGNYVFASGVHVAEHANVAPVLGGMLVGLLESAMVVLDDGVEEVSEDGVSLGIRGINAHARVRIFQS